MTNTIKTEEELKKELTPEEYHVLCEQGTEAPFSGKYWNTSESGMYQCKVCGQILFPSDAKMDSTKGPAGLRGWPSFDQALPGAVEYRDDNNLGMKRTEVICSKCKSHLGHIFEDETKTGQHFCINSCALDFQKNNGK
ncbi:peptide-methionine (R)-S-oxide reductase [Candidatus Nomurabacteria bacterium RIFCSPHIGHO2_01_FULL_39_9]|uniref:peptide-methionine (R)-S-oxide reductase n=1 Tax=Candidatus Nomurabacteria bacterium RIFCSPHIGHO2_01_FULL_39_9 TaxID=1801735 RepID=A0A1F6UWN1_9BACT|nr:MAG: peptide-methionine (R)-S-oxide reductase [Candidatus Nomurabacteria bacterium RIFCSPHIGHO2_01_FULL_39_9]